MSANPNDHDEQTPPALVDPPATETETSRADALPPESVTPAEPVPSREPTTDAEPVSHEAPATDHTSAEHVSTERASTEPVTTEPVATEPASTERVPAETGARVDGPVVPYASAPVVPTSEAPTPIAPVSAAPPQYAPQYQQPERVFVPPLPVAPTKKGNRGIGSLIAVLSVVIFALIYAIVAGIIIAVRAPGDAVPVSLRFLTDPVFFVPAILFAVGFVIVVLLVNRSGWWAHVIGSLFVAAVVYFGTIGYQLLTVGGFGLTPDEASARFFAYGANPFVIAAALVARETSLWIGAVIASRGRRMKNRNTTARADFDRATAEHRAEYERAYAPVS